MPKEELFKSPFESKKEEKEKLIKERGIYYFEEEDPETGERKKYVNIMGIKIEAEASKEDIEEIKRELLMSELDQKLFRRMAQAYVLRQPMMIEGAPAAGKTFAIKYFTKLLYGKDAEPLTIYGTNRTESDTILGHWVPKTESEKEKKLWNEFLESAEGKKATEDIIEELKGKKDLLEEQRQNILREKLKELAKSIGLSHLTEFEFKEGPLLKAYSADNGKGYILDVEELGVIPTNVQETFLPIGGERGTLAKTIQFWENGRMLYKLGPKTWIVFASNPPEEVGARHEVTTALASRLVWFRIEEEAIQPKVEALIDNLYTKEKPEIKPENIFIYAEKPIDFTQYPELAKSLALAAKTFHTQFVEAYSSLGEKDRNQKFEISARDAARVVDFLLKFQKIDPETGEIDLVGTFEEAIDFYYLSRLADKDLKEKMKNTLKEILYGKTSPGYKIYKKSLAEKIKEEVENADPEKQKIKLLENLNKEIEKIYKIPKEYENWNVLRESISELNQILKEINDLKESAQKEENLQNAIDLFKKALEKTKEVQTISQNIKTKIEERKKIEEQLEKLKKSGK
jgi:hypothetical protein